MKSKRKEINKYKTRPEEEHIDQGFFLRTSGNKPFQLRKLRVTQRHSTALKCNNDFVSDMHKFERYSAPSQNIDFDLVIHKKTLINSKRNQKLKSQRRKIILDYQKQAHQQIQEGKEGDTKTEEELLEPKDFVVLSQYNSEQFDEGVNRKKKQKGCAGCHQLHIFANNAIVCHQRGKDNLSPQAINEKQVKQDQHNINEHKNQFDLKEQLKQVTSKSIHPSSAFINIKWRSKSQIFKVDKWKEKYGGSEFTKPNGQSKENAKRGLIAIMERKFSQKNSQMSRKINFMEKEYSQKITYATMPSKEVTSIHEKKLQFHKKQQKAQNINNPEKNHLAEEKNRNQSPQQIGQKLEKEGIEQYNPPTIVIKQMFNEGAKILSFQNAQTKKNVEENEEAIEEQILSQGQRELKLKKKKWILPSIQISTFNSTREELEDQRRKTTKILNIQKLQREWKQKPPKQIFLEKMLQQIPQRWEHGQSRDISRQQVGTYIHLKQEQELKEQVVRQMEERRLAEIRRQQEELFGNVENVEN